MTPEEREKRIEAAREAIYAEWSRSEKPRATWSDLARVALDAADRAVQVVSALEHERTEAAARAYATVLEKFARRARAFSVRGYSPPYALREEILDADNVLAAYPNFTRGATNG